MIKLNYYILFNSPILKCWSFQTSDTYCIYRLVSTRPVALNIPNWTTWGRPWPLCPLSSPLVGHRTHCDNYLVFLVFSGGFVDASGSYQLTYLFAAVQRTYNETNQRSPTVFRRGKTTSMRDFFFLSFVS